MRRALAMIGAVALTPAAPAYAKVIDAHASLIGGAATGTGIGGAQKDNDFFAGSKGGDYGIVLGVQVLVIDARISHERFTTGGTWSQLVIGPRLAIPTTGSLYADVGAAAGFGVGTGQPIQGSLSNDEVTDKGVIVELHAGLDYRWEIFGFGVMVPIGWGYMFKNGVPANDTSNHYSTFRASILGVLSIRLGL